MNIETLAAEIQSGVQHGRGLPSSFEDARSMLRGRPSFIAFLAGGLGWLRFQEPAAAVSLTRFLS
jgi:hypothetical protein